MFKSSEEDMLKNCKDLHLKLAVDSLGEVDIAVFNKIKALKLHSSAIPLEDPHQILRIGVKTI